MDFKLQYRPPNILMSWGFNKKISFVISLNNFGCPIPITEFHGNEISFRKSNIK